MSITAAGLSLVTVSRQKLEAGLFEGVTTYDKAIRLNVPTPSYQGTWKTTINRAGARTATKSVPEVQAAQT